MVSMAGDREEQAPSKTVATQAYAALMRRESHIQLMAAMGRRETSEVGGGCVKTGWIC